MSREQDALFAEKVLGKKVWYFERWESPHYSWPGYDKYALSIHWAPTLEWYEVTEIERAGSRKVIHLSEYSKNYSLVTGMMEGIDALLGGESTVVLHFENGRYCAMVDWVDDTGHHSRKNYGDGTPNGALLALGLAVADAVQNQHGEIAMYNVPTAFLMALHPDREIWDKQATTGGTMLLEQVRILQHQKDAYKKALKKVCEERDSCGRVVREYMRNEAALSILLYQVADAIDEWFPDDPEPIMQGDLRELAREMRDAVGKEMMEMVWAEVNAALDCAKSARDKE
jgi:hypothetical protein